jgi:hypothetical protein
MVNHRCYKPTTVVLSMLFRTKTKPVQLLPPCTPYTASHHGNTNVGLQQCSDLTTVTIGLATPHQYH